MSWWVDRYDDEAACGGREGGRSGPRQPRTQTKKREGGERGAHTGYQIQKRGRRTLPSLLLVYTLRNPCLRGAPRVLSPVVSSYDDAL